VWWLPLLLSLRLERVWMVVPELGKVDAAAGCVGNGGGGASGVGDGIGGGMVGGMGGYNGNGAVHSTTNNTKAPTLVPPAQPPTDPQPISPTNAHDLFGSSSASTTTTAPTTAPASILAPESGLPSMTHQPFTPPTTAHDLFGMFVTAAGKPMVLNRYN